MILKEEDMKKVQHLVKVILGITDNEIMQMKDSSELFRTVKEKIKGLNDKEINEICYVMTKVGEE